MLLQANVLLALMAAVLWGGGDFSGGMGVRNVGGTAAGALRVVLISHASSLAALLLVVVLRHEPMPRGALLGWGLLAGLCAGVSLTCFYIALSRGAMGAAAAVSGLLAAAIPAIVSMVVEGRPTVLRAGGFALAAVAIWLIAAGPTAEGAQRSTMTLAIVSGVGFGVYFVSLRMANPLGVFMPMTLARIGSLITCLIALMALALQRRSPARNGFTVSRAGILWAIAAGALDCGGNLLFIAATRAGRLDIAAVLASLYPASTIALAGWLLHERLLRRQWAGMGLALAAVLMVTL